MTHPSWKVGLQINKIIDLESFLVIILCANLTTVREIMLAAEELQMVSTGEYVFFNIELYSRWVFKRRQFII